MEQLAAEENSPNEIKSCFSNLKAITGRLPYLLVTTAC